jgi:Tol biopolymer transport system component
VIHHARRARVAILLSLLAIAAAAAPVSATFPGTNGRIAFMRFDEFGLFQVWTANPDLTHQVQLTHAPDDGWFPHWSPDRTRIAFSSGRSDPDRSDGIEVHDVFTMRADGTDVRKVTDSVGYSATPSWSPDGRWLVFSADRADYPSSQGTYRIASDGTGPITRVTSLPAGSVWQELARYSPDGKRLVFTEYRQLPSDNPDDPPIEQSALFTVRHDGRDARQLTPWAISAADADWSPDGRQIVFSARLRENQQVQSVMVVDPNGQHLRQLTSGDGVSGDGPDFRYQESFNPAWSPDGSKIIFVRARYTDADGFAMGLMTMRPDGRNAAFISTLPAEEHQPDWGTARPFR